MELVYELLLPAFTGIMVSFLVAKLVAMALRSEELASAKGLCRFGGGDVGIGEERGNLVESSGIDEFKLENRLWVESSRSTKKRAKDIGGENLTFSEFQVEAEPALVATENLGESVNSDELSDRRIGCGLSDKGDDFPVDGVQFVKEEQGLADLVGMKMEKTSSVRLSALVTEKLGSPKFGYIKQQGIIDFFIDSGEQTGKFGSSEKSWTEGGLKGAMVLKEEVGSMNDPGINAGFESDRVDAEDDVVRPELPNYGFDQRAGVGEGDMVLEKLVNDTVIAQGRHIYKASYGENEGKERDETQRDVEAPGMESLNDDNVVTDCYKHERILEFEGIKSKGQSEHGEIHQIDDPSDNIRTLVVAKEDEQNGRKEGESVEKDVEISSDGEEWEGIERSELEKDFAKAVNFVECGDKESRLSKVSNDVIMRLYGLQKIAMEGPCHEPPPMALKLSARAKWNAWKKLESMNPEEAMEQYISLLSENVPGWMDSRLAVIEGGKNSVEARAHNCKDDANLQLSCTDERKPEKESVMEMDELTGGSISINKDNE